MVRAILATIAALLLVGVLSLLIVESRAVREDYYIAHAERLRAIESSRGAIDTIVQDTRSAFNEGRAIPAAFTTAVANLNQNLRILTLPTEPSVAESQVPAGLAAYEEQLDSFIASGEAFAARQNAQAAALLELQEESPETVKDLRRFNLRIESQNAFSLALDVIEFAMGRSTSTPEQLSERIDTLRNDSTVADVAPGRLDDFAAAAHDIVAEHTAAETALARIGNSTIARELAALSEAILADNRRIVSRVERARELLAVCAVLLLLGAGFAMYRLQNSYRDLNQSNAALAKLNDSLEQMVAARTEELSKAIDELKESQVQLVQAEKMSSLGELVAGISHEINTPLWYLMSNASVIQERLADIVEFLDVAEKMVLAARSRTGVKEAVSAGLGDMNDMLNAGMKDDMAEARDLVQDSIEGLEELTELAQSLKDFSRLDRAKQGEFNVNEGLKKTLLIIRNKIKNKVTVHKHFGEVPNILCSPSQINQVFLNLIGNASDAIEKEGDIVLHTWQDGDRIGVRVADTGCGIPEDAMAKVRDPFFTTKEVGKGTGLGLSIVDQIVTAHHGELNIESVQGKGTTITVMLPLVPPADAAPDDKAAVGTEAAAPAGAAAATKAVDVAAPVAGEDSAMDANAQTAAGGIQTAQATADNTAANAGRAAAPELPATDDWAGDTNVPDESPTDQETGDWAGDTHVSESDEVVGEAVTASNDGDDNVQANSASDWASETNVSGVKIVAEDAENDDVIDVDEDDNDAETAAATDVRPVLAEAAAQAADPVREDEMAVATGVNDLDEGNEGDDVGIDTVVADWNIDSEVVDLFAHADPAGETGVSETGRNEAADRNSTGNEPDANTAGDDDLPAGSDTREPR